LPKVRLVKENTTGSGTTAPVGYREVYMRDGFVKTAVYDRSDFKSGAIIEGPAIVEQLDSTTVIFPGQRAEVDDFGNIIIPLAKTTGKGE